MRDHEKRDVVERLKAYQAAIRGVFDLVGQPMLSRQNRERAQEQMKALKEKLRADYHRVSTVSGRETLTAVEQAYFRPAVQQAATTIRVKWNSNPSRAWSSELYSALIDVEYALNGLERQECTLRDTT